jgi:L,D-transpeptidase ErfK/SrfK
MNSSIRPALGRVILLASALLAAGCQLTRHAEPPPPPPPPEPPPIEAPLATHTFRFNPATDDVVGEIQITHVQGEDTLPDIARRFNVGYEELVRANPGVDPWLPGVGRAIVVPTQFVLPKAPREGIVVNLAQLRVFYFPKPPKLKKGEVDDGMRTVITHPIGIGKVGWETPVGTTKVIGKQKNPTWVPPPSVRKEHAEAGDPLPARVPPGPDNPLGAYKLVLGWPSYLMHGTNKPYGVGLRSSHGCIRFYPEDIAALYDQITVGTKVTVVNQPFVFGWRDGELYAQAFPILEDDKREHPDAAEQLLNAAISDEMWQQLKDRDLAVDLELVNEMVKQRRGISMPVSRRNLTVESYLARARHVENRVPDGATWNYTEEGLFLAEEFEAVRNGLPLPKKKTPPKQKQTVAKPAGAASGS